MSEAQRQALALMARMNEVARPERSTQPGLRLLGVGQIEAMRALAALELTTRRSALGLQPWPSFDPEDISYELDARSRARGVDLRMITPPRTLRFHPLLTSLSPQILIGPVLVKCIVIDGKLAVIAGPETVAGDSTAWLADDGEFLTRALDLWEITLQESRPALPPGAEPPLNARQLDVARGVCLGKTDAAIARQLRISERTVARDVATVLEVTDARSRNEAILNMLGRGRQSRT